MLMRENVMKRGKYHYDNNFTINPKEYGDLLLYQLGELMCDSSTVVDAHTHLDWYELTYVFSGKGTIYTNTVPAKVKANDVYVSKPKEIHKLVSDSSDPMRYCFVAFNFKKNSPLYDVLTKDNGFALEKTDRVFNMPEFENSFQHLLSYIYNDEDVLNNLLLERELESIVLKMLKYIKHNNFKTYSPPKINNIEMLSFNIINYIDNNLTTIDKTSRLSQIFNYNYSYISRCFKNTTGLSISEYFTDKKLAVAKKIIEEGNMSITEISNHLNYTSIYVFSRAFKNKYGISPKLYKEQTSGDKS